MLCNLPFGLLGSLAVGLPGIWWVLFTCFGAHYLPSFFRQYFMFNVMLIIYQGLNSVENDDCHESGIFWLSSWVTRPEFELWYLYPLWVEHVPFFREKEKIVKWTTRALLLLLRESVDSPMKSSFCLFCQEHGTLLYWNYHTSRSSLRLLKIIRIRLT